MLIFRGAVTYHPRGSSSAPLLSPYYWMPPTSVSCTGVSEVQGMLAPFSAPTQFPRGAPSPPAPLRPPRPEGQHGKPAVPSGAAPADAYINFPGPQREAKTNKKLGYMFLILSAIGFVCFAAVAFAAGQLLREDINDERWLTEEDAAPRSLIPDPSALDASGDSASRVATHKSATPAVSPANDTKGAKAAGLTPSTATTLVKGRSSKISRRGHSVSSRRHQGSFSTVRFVSSHGASRSSGMPKHYRVFPSTVAKLHQKLSTSVSGPRLVKLKKMSLSERDKVFTPSHLVDARGHVGKGGVPRGSGEERTQTGKKRKNTWATPEGKAISPARDHVKT
ncbi:hypothetical protein V5799_029526 [Amblyomma americanum]|uniref:Transmembrane protein n=1 Tax=Amblyomma americanum TaxID=6943 RepID=A0AAQ4ER42_AMBAM